MNTIKQPAQAGTLESNDIVVTVAPADNGVSIEIISIVKAQYGPQIREAIAAVLREQAIESAFVTVNDRGALDCTIRARVLAALSRSGAVVKEAV